MVNGRAYPRPWVAGVVEDRLMTSRVIRDWLVIVFSVFFLLLGLFNYLVT